jgi:hypothetical protein
MMKIMRGSIRQEQNSERHENTCNTETDSFVLKREREEAVLMSANISRAHMTIS